MLLMVYAADELVPHISHMDADLVGTGILGMGNKGGVSLCFQAFDSTFCFVASHLAAHDDEVSRRNQDFSEISRRTRFSPPCCPTIAEHDFIFWLGDLNYRISNKPSDEVKALVEDQ